RHAGTQGEDFAEYAHELPCHAGGAAEPHVRVFVGGAQDEAVQRVVPAEHRLLDGGGDAVGVASVDHRQADDERGEGAANGVQVRGDGGARLGDLGRLEAGGAV